MLLKYLGVILFFLMLVAPFEFNGVKIFIIAVLMIHRLFLIFKNGKLSVSSSVFSWFLILILFGLFFSFWSLLFPFSNIIFILKILPVYVVWPIVYLLLTPYLLNKGVIVLLNKTMVYASLFISIYLIFAFLSLFGLLPIPFEKFTLAKVILGRTESMEANLFMPAVTSLLFLNPFLLTSLILGLNKKYGVNQILLFITFVFANVAILLTGRRSLMLNLLISPIIIFIFLKFSHVKLKKKEKKYILWFTSFLMVTGGVLFSYLTYLEIIDFGEFWDFFISGLNFGTSSNDVGSSVRGRQFFLLLKSWMDYPILGTGLASYSEYVIRSSETPWAYELSYVAWLFQTGLIGFIIYISLLGWIFVKAIFIIRKNINLSYIIPIFVGSITFLIGCASNPYLQAFDHMWAIFLPAGIINYCVINKYTDI